MGRAQVGGHTPRDRSSCRQSGRRKKRKPIGDFRTDSARGKRNFAASCRKVVRRNSAATARVRTQKGMIHLDTNYLIGSLSSPSTVRNQIRAWFGSGEILAVSAVSWSEFSNGPVTVQQIQDARGIVQGRIVAFDVPEAEMAAKLFNSTGRKRATQTDCFIAATAICARVPLATLNRKDFIPFTAAGLQLV